MCLLLVVSLWPCGLFGLDWLAVVLPLVLFGVECLVCLCGGVECVVVLFVISCVVFAFCVGLCLVD